MSPRPSGSARIREHLDRAKARPKPAKHYAVLLTREEIESLIPDEWFRTENYLSALEKLKAALKRAEKLDGTP